MILFVLISFFMFYYPQDLCAQEYAQTLHNTMWADFLYYDKQHAYATDWYKNSIQECVMPYPLRSYSLLLFDMQQFGSLLHYKNQLQAHFKDDIEIQKAIAIALTHEKKNKEAATLFIELAEKFPGSYDVVLPAAQILIQQGNLVNARLALEKIINTRMQRNLTPICMVLLAQVYLKENNIDAAHTILTQCTTYQPSYTPAWLVLGALEEVKNNIPAALHAYNTYLLHSAIHNPQIEQHIQALNVKHTGKSVPYTIKQSDTQHALTLIMQQNYPAALQVIRNGLYKNKNDAYLRALYIHALVTTESYTTALVTLTHYIQEKPTDNRWWGALHLLALHPNIEISALATLKTMQRQHPHIVWGYLYTADCALRKNNYSDAHALYTQALCIAQDDPLRAELYFMQALCGYELHDYTLVSRAINNGLQCTCVHAPLNNLAAYYYAHSGNYEKADTLIAQCCTLEPQNHHYQDTAAFIAYKKGNLTDAEKIYAILHKTHPTDATISLHAAQAAAKQNNFAQSRELLAQAENHAYSKYEKRRIQARLHTGTL